MESITCTLCIVFLSFIGSYSQKVSIDKSILAGAQNEPSNGVIVNDNILWFNYLNGAFRAGRLTSDAWAPSNTGLGSAAFGLNTIASGSYSMAINDRSKAMGVSSFASGFSSEAIGNYSMAFGLFARAGARGSVAVGQYNIGNGNPLAQVTTDPIFEIGNGANSGNRANAMTVLKNGKVGLKTINPSDRFHIQSNIGEDPFRVQVDNSTKLRIFSNGSIAMGSNNGNIGADDVYIHEDLGIGINNPSERLDVNGAIKLGPSKNDFSGTIRFQNNDIEGRVGGAWKSLTNAGNLNGDLDSLVVNDQLYLGDENTGFYISPFGTITDHGKSLIFDKETVDDVGAARWAYSSILRKGGDFCNLMDGPNPEFRINLGAKNYYFKEEGLSYSFSNVNINIGYHAGLSDTTTISATGNTQIGHNAGKSNTDGSGNVLIGSSAGSDLVSGSSNTFVGGGAGRGSEAEGSVAVGSGSGGGDFNVLVGRNAGAMLAEGFGNVILGNNAGINNNSNSNIFIGSGSGFSNTGSGNVFIGNSAGANAVGNNKLYIENSNSIFPLLLGDFFNDRLTVNGAFKIVEAGVDIPLEVRAESELKFRVASNGNLFIQNRMGFDNSNPTYRIQLPNNSANGEGRGLAYAWASYSDQRVKQDIENVPYGLQEIMQLKPKKYKHFTSNFKNQKLELSDSYDTDIGFLAQEVYQVIEEIVEKPENENNALWSMNYEKLTPVLVKAIQEQQSIIEDLKSKHLVMESEMNEIKALLLQQVSNK